MTRHTILLLLLLLLSACATQRRAHTETSVMHHDTLAVTLADSTLHTRHLTATDRAHAITITDVLRTIYLDGNGCPTRIDERILTQRDETRDRDLTAADTLLTASSVTANAVHAADSLSQQDQVERGDAARTPWQSFLRRLTTLQFWLPIIAIFLLYAHLKWIGPWIIRHDQ